MQSLIPAAILLLAIAGLSWRHGGWPERLVALSMAAGLLAAVVIQYHPLGRLPHFGVFIVDLALLTVLVGVALRSDRWWPLFCCAFVLLAATSGLALAFDQHLERLNTVVDPSVWNALALISLGVGLFEVASRVRVKPSAQGSPERDG